MANRSISKKSTVKKKSGPAATKSNITPGKVFLFTFGIAALGGAVYLTREYYRNHKNESTQGNTPEQKQANYSNKTYNYFSSGGDSFPLKKGSKGQRVLQLQQALANTLGQDVMASNGGIDGVFGKGTENALKLAGYGKTVNESLFNQIVKNEPTIIFDPREVAQQIYQNAADQNSAGVLEALSKIKDVTSYSAANQVYMKLGFYSKKILTDLMDVSFKNDEEAKASFRKEFHRIGLKQDSESGNWSLSGTTGIRDIITISDTYIIDEDQNRIMVSKNTILGDEQQIQNGMTIFKAIDNSYGAVPTEHVRYV